MNNLSMHSVCEVVRTLISSLQASSGTATISPGPHCHHEYHPLPHDRGCYSHCGTLWWEVAHHYRKTTLKCCTSSFGKEIWNWWSFSYSYYNENNVHTTTLKTLIASCSLLRLSMSVIQLLDSPLSAGTKLSPPNTWHNCGCRTGSKCQCTLSLKRMTGPKHLNINTLSLSPAAFPGHHPLRPTESVVSCTLAQAVHLQI